VQASAPDVLPKSLFGNQLVAEVLTSHYVHGEAMSRICERLRLAGGSLLAMAHHTAAMFSEIVEQLRTEYRQAAVRHADETEWRTAGQSGYAWLFSTETLSIFLFRRSRSSRVAKEILGEEPLGCVLVVDRWPAYNRAPVCLQYCDAHLLRDVEDLQKEFPANTEVSAFTATLIPLLAEAMHLRRQNITDAEYYRRAQQLKEMIILVTEESARAAGHP